VAGRWAKGDIILKDKAEKDASAVKCEDAVTHTASWLEEGQEDSFCLRSSTEPEGATSASVATETFRATAPSVFAWKRKVEQFIGDESRTAIHGEKGKIPRSEKMSNGDLKRILQHKKHHGTAALPVHSR
jgi:hypothetical protein